MSKKIKVRRYGVIHYIAYCDICNFEASINTEETPYWLGDVNRLDKQE